MIAYLVITWVVFMSIAVFMLVNLTSGDYPRVERYWPKMDIIRGLIALGLATHTTYLFIMWVK